MGNNILPNTLVKSQKPQAKPLLNMQKHWVKP